jgi:hypothetical protein
MKDPLLAIDSGAAHARIYWARGLKGTRKVPYFAKSGQFESQIDHLQAS